MALIVVYAYCDRTPGPGPNERAVHAEVLTGEPWVLLGDGQHGIEQLDHRIVRNQTLAVFGEDRGHPDAVVHGQAYEPAKQQAVLPSSTPNGASY